jgi:predicted nuclease with TOPRIM domain
MAELIKSTVKCYKKKTKKTVGGENKTYEYNQYQVPLKKSDNLVCEEEVFIIPQNYFEGLIEAEVESQLEDLEQHKEILVGYKKELADLEWKHNELSRSYKSLVSKNAQTNKKICLVEEKNTNLERENRKFKNQLQQLMKDYKDLKEKIKGKDDSELKKDVDILKQIRSRFSSSRDGEKDE